MCLCRLYEEMPAQYTKVTKGYKVFTQILSGFKPSDMNTKEITMVEFNSLLINGIYPVNEWIQDHKKLTLRADDGSYYSTGFHIFLTKQGAEEYKIPDSEDSYGEVVREVEFRDPVAWGNQGSVFGEVVVARKMKILEKQHVSS